MDGLLDTIICGNNADVLAIFPDACIDLTVTSPPYDKLRKYKGYTWDFEGVAQQLWRVTKPGGVVVWVVGDETVNGSETGTSFRQALRFMEIGFNLHDTMIFEKNSAAFPEKNRYYNIFEYMFALSKGAPAIVSLIQDKPNAWGGTKTRGKVTERQADGTFVTSLGRGSADEKGRKTVKEFGVRNNIWRYATGHGVSAKDACAHDHPAIFPEALAQDHILSWSNPGDVVLDPFVGSGTTAKMALLNGRHYIGIDISEEYCALARHRVAKAQALTATRGE